MRGQTSAHVSCMHSVMFAVPNISTINLILRRLESYDGVNKVEPITVTSGIIYQDWLRNEIDKRIISQKYSSLTIISITTICGNNNDRLWMTYLSQGN